MTRFARIWNGRPAGVPAALLVGLQILWRRLADRFVTALARGNLGSLGSGAVVQAGATIRHPGRVHIGARTSVASDVEIATELPGSECRIGSDVIIGAGVRLDFSGTLTIGDGVVISEDAVIYTHSHGLKPKSVPTPTPLVIEAGAWLGSRVVIIEGCSRIGAGAVVASGSVVTREVPPGVVVAGVPARVIKAA